MRILLVWWLMLWPSLLFGQEAPLSIERGEYGVIKFDFMKAAIPVETLLDPKSKWVSGNEGKSPESSIKPLASVISIGYRRENSINFLTKHLFDFKSSYDFEIKPVHLAARIGLEWGKSPTKYIFTHHTSSSPRPGLWERRTKRPTSPPRNSATLYPLAEFSVKKESRFLTLRSGARINVLKFRIEEYNFQPPGVTIDITRTYELAPSVFLKMEFGKK